MRPKRFSYTFAALDADGFAAAVTGAIQTTPWTTILGSPANGCAHQTTLTLASGSSLAGVTITVTGTDAEGRTQTEAIAGPSGTTNMTKYFATVTSITSSATLGASTMNVGWTTLCSTPAIPVAVYPHDGAVVSISPASCTLTMQQTVSPIYDTAAASVVWQTLIASGTAAAVAQALIGITAIRALVSVSSPGTLTIDIAQARQ
jgi:hypothetical protein